MIVRDDLALLRTRINLPATVTAARWTVLPVGTTDSVVPGPTDTVLYAYLTTNDGEPGSFGPQPKEGTPQETVTLPEEVALAIVPASELNNLKQQGNSRRVVGPAYDPSHFNRGSYRGVFAVLLGKGMIISLQTQ